MIGDSVGGKGLEARKTGGDDRDSNPAFPGYTQSFGYIGVYPERTKLGIRKQPFFLLQNDPSESFKPIHTSELKKKPFQYQREQKCITSILTAYFPNRVPAIGFIYSTHKVPIIVPHPHPFPPHPCGHPLLQSFPTGEISSSADSGRVTVTGALWWSFTGS